MAFELLRIEEVAARLRLSRAMTYRLAQEGKLPVVRFGRAVRVEKRALEEWIVGRTIPIEMAGASGR